jgi:hypothetical protein
MCSPARRAGGFHLLRIVSPHAAVLDFSRCSHSRRKRQGDSNHRVDHGADSLGWAFRLGGSLPRSPTRPCGGARACRHRRSALDNTAAVDDPRMARSPSSRCNWPSSRAPATGGERQRVLVARASRMTLAIARHESQWDSSGCSTEEVGRRIWTSLSELTSIVRRTCAVYGTKLAREVKSIGIPDSAGNVGDRCVGGDQEFACASAP